MARNFMMGERGIKYRYSKSVLKYSTQINVLCYCPPLPLPDPTQTQSQDRPGYLPSLSSEFSVSVSTGQAHRTRAKQNPDVGRPSTSSNHSRRGCSGSRRTVSTDSSPGITPSSSWSLPEAHVERGSRESLNLCSRGSYSVEGSWSGDGLESPSEKGLSRSDSFEGFLCPPLPGQVPVEPTETSTGRTAQGAVEASPVNESSTESFESLYNVEQLIGSGGYGRVFLGTRKFDGKKVAIKRTRKSDNDRYLYIPGNPELLVTEVALLMMMRREPISPFVIQLYEWFEHPKEFTLVMEYPEHYESLYDLIARHPWSEWFSRVVMRQAVRAVLHCIHHGVFHSDIHSQNFLFEKDTLDLRLIDFGCGQLFSSEGYESVTYKGFLEYCPPEVFTEPRFHAVPANVWSLGVLLYELSNLLLPFQDKTEITEAEVTFQNPDLSKRVQTTDTVSDIDSLSPAAGLIFRTSTPIKWPSKRPRLELEEEDDEETLMDTSSVVAPEEQDYTFDPAETDTTLTETADMSAQAKWQNETLDRLSERERVIVGGDMRADSPGHSAKFGSYTLMDLQTNTVVDTPELVQSHEVGGSYHMEKGLQRSLALLEARGVTLECIVTDRHPQIQKYLRA
ncbi:unnamed protein product [Leuciscus chuanchicus]